MGRLANLFIGLVSIPVVIAVVLGVSGYFLFTRAHMDQVRKADAIIVLGGEHDGREAYALRLAAQGYADTVVLSDPYPPWDTYFRSICEKDRPGITVLCVPPEPSTTLGEAILTERLAKENGWTHVMVVSWRFHLPRARFVFGQCFDGEVTMLGVPREYRFSLAEWEYNYLYQLSGFVKATVQGPSACTSGTL